MCYTQAKYSAISRVMMTSSPIMGPRTGMKILSFGDAEFAGLRSELNRGKGIHGIPTPCVALFHLGAGIQPKGNITKWVEPIM